MNLFSSNKILVAWICVLPLGCVCISFPAIAQDDLASRVSASFTLRGQPVLLGDVSYVEVKLTNHNDQHVFIQLPEVGNNINFRRSGLNQEFRLPNETLNIHVYDGLDIGYVQRVKLEAHETNSVVLAIRNLSGCTDRNYPEVHDFSRNPPGLDRVNFTIDFTAYFEFSKTSNRGLAPWSKAQQRVVGLIRRQSASIRIDGIALKSYADTCLVHGRRTLSEEASGMGSGLIGNERFFPMNIDKWKGLRTRINPKSNLARLLSISDKYWEIIASGASDVQKVESVFELLDSKRPLEYRWMMAKLGKQLHVSLGFANPNEASQRWEQLIVSNDHLQ